jgi:peptidoglycan hydrolase-like protein with peptidoglycan-binding domain
VSAPQTFDTMQSSCQEQRQVVSSDLEAVSAARDTLAADEASAGSAVSADEQQVSTDEQQVSADSEALSLARSEMTNPGTRFTTLPAVGDRIGRGQAAYWLDGRPIPLFYGATTPYRAMYLGVANGPDVAELQGNLVALGYGAGLRADGNFDLATQQAVEAWQAALGVPVTGVVSLGDIVVEPGALRVLSVTAALGQSAQAGTAVLSASSTTREVTIALDASLQANVKVGDPVTITLPDNSTTPGVVSSVGSVASEPAGGGGAGSTGQNPTITVEVTPTDPAATGGLDQAPVQVAITNASVTGVLAVPVDALLALSGGGYALEEVSPGGQHHLVAVSLGLFDDAEGMVQVSGAGLAAGQRIVVPNL